MNKFTKEELQELHRCITYMIKGGTTPYSSLTMQLRKKLKSMIENNKNPTLADLHHDE